MYWIDPENNTNPLSVYCDMTTDGGKLRPGQIFVYFAKIFAISKRATLFFPPTNNLLYRIKLSRHRRPASEQNRFLSSLETVKFYKLQR